MIRCGTENTMPLIEDLIRAAEQDYKGWKNQARFYGTVSSGVRMLLIVSSALVAADKTLTSHLPAGWEALFPSLSVLVAIGTALDAWLKPRDKWKGFLSDRDAANLLLMKARNVDKSDVVKIEAYLEEFRLLEQRPIEKN